MSQRKLLALVIVVCLGVAASLAWYLAGDVAAAKERAELRPSPIPTSEAMPPGKILGARPVAGAPAVVELPRGT
jgi:hypothetical protein